MNDILLDYSEKRGGWFAEVGLELITMSDATFQRHVIAYLQSQGITEPTQEQLIEARGYCRHLSFWKGCTDPDVRWYVFGTQAIDQQKKRL
jgi:hypothetical protein